MWKALLLFAGTIALPSLAVPVGDMIDEEPSPGTEIFNGQDAEPHAWPFMAHIIRRGSFVCGAALIARKWVITAGHCVAYSSSLYSVVLGDHDRTKSEGTEQVIPVNRVLIHPRYDISVIENDIALLELAFPANTTVPEVSRINRFATRRDDRRILRPQTKCYVIGWGRETNDNDVWRLAPILQQLQVTILNNTRCTAVMLGTNHPITNICYEAPLSATCNGDSGSPVVCKVGRRWKLVGVHSYKLKWDGCRGGPKAGTRVSSFVRWINSVL